MLYMRQMKCTSSTVLAIRGKSTDLKGGKKIFGVVSIRAARAKTERCAEISVLRNWGRARNATVKPSADHLKEGAGGYLLRFMS